MRTTFSVWSAGAARSTEAAAAAAIPDAIRRPTFIAARTISSAAS
jgi:hypothetical protein